MKEMALSWMMKVMGDGWGVDKKGPPQTCIVLALILPLQSWIELSYPHLAP